MILSASILSADFGRLADEARAVERAGADWIHLDIMDGHFVPNMTVGPKAVAAVREATDLPLDVHLMITNPERYVEAYAGAGANRLGVHAETAPHLHRLISQVRESGARPTVVLNPATPLCALEHVLGDVDMVLVMTVNPGFGGQSFIHSMLDKVRRCRSMIDAQDREVLLQVDGGVHKDTIGPLARAGVDVCVAGSAVFGGGDYAENIRGLRERAE